MAEEKLDYNIEGLSTIDVSGKDSKISNQDARKVFVSKGSEKKRTGDFMLGNDNKNLANGEYISVDEYVVALNKLFANKQVKKVVLKKTGKEVTQENLSKIVDDAKRAGYIVLTDNPNIKNQKAKNVSIKTESMKEEKRVSAMFLGKNGVDMANGEYALREELGVKIVKKERKVIPIEPGKDIPDPEPVPPQFRRINPKIPKALISIAITAGLIALLPNIMHANSVLWHHSTPMIQDVLHMMNLGIGKVLNFSFLNDGSGLWLDRAGNLFNADAATSSLGIALATHGITFAGLAKIVYDLKKGVKYLTEKKGGMAR